MCSLDPAVAFFYTAPAAPLIVATCVILVGVLTLCYADVIKQNAGLLVSWRHARPRVLKLSGYFLLFGSILSFFIAAAQGVWVHELHDMPSLWRPIGAGSPLENLVLPALPPFEWSSSSAVAWLGWGVRGAVQGFAAALLGGLLQWFWEDRSALDPV